MKEAVLHKGYLLLCMLFACLISFSCGGADDPVTPPSPTPTPTPTPAPTPDPEPEPEPEPEPAPPAHYQRTVILYMAGDNTLSHLLKTDGSGGDIGELLEGASLLGDDALTDNAILVFADTEDKDFLPTIWRVEKDAEGQAVLTLVKQYDTEVVSTDPAVIQEVVDLAKYSYPAHSYGFVYWSHGDGWHPAKVSALRAADPLRYIGIDHQNGTLKDKNRVMTEVADLAKVLSSMGQPFEYVMFDACYMLSLEAVFEMRNCAKYVIASPTETPGPGAPYDTMAAAMLEDDAAVKMGEIFYAYYAERYDGNDKSIPTNDHWHGGVAIGVVDCSQLDALASATSQGLNGVTGVDNLALREALFNYDRRSQVGLHYYFDMVDLMQAFMDDEAFTTWQTVYQNALVLWNTTPKYYSSASRWFSMETAHGLTHYIPKTNDCSADMDVAYRSTSWYQAAGLSQLGW